MSMLPRFALAMTLGGLLQAAVAPAEEATATTAPAAQNFATLIAGDLVRADGSAAPADALAGKTVLLYFSAHWCPPCRGFTPVLVKAYDTWKAQGKPVEIVFVSSDHSAEAMKTYMTEARMNWLAVPFADQTRKAALAARWNVRGIPALVVVSPAGETLSDNARDVVATKQDKALDDWVK